MFNYNKKYYKILPVSMKADGVTIRQRLNTVRMDVNPDGSVTGEGFYIYDMEHVLNYKLPGLCLVQITVPKEALVVEGPNEGEYRVNMINVEYICRMTMDSIMTRLKKYYFSLNFSSPQFHDRLIKDGMANVLRWVYDNGFINDDDFQEYLIKAANVGKKRILHAFSNEIDSMNIEPFLFSTIKNSCYPSFGYLFRLRGHEISSETYKELLELSITEIQLNSLKLLCENIPSDIDISGIMPLAIKTQDLAIIRWLNDNIVSCLIKGKKNMDICIKMKNPTMCKWLIKKGVVISELQLIEMIRICDENRNVQYRNYFKRQFKERLTT